MWEHIDVTNGVRDGSVSGIREEVDRLLASDPASYAKRTVKFWGTPVTQVPWIEEDLDTELEAAHATAKDEYNRLSGELRDKEKARREARKLASNEPKATGKPKGDLTAADLEALKPLKDRMSQTHSVLARKRNDLNAAAKALKAAKGGPAIATAKAAKEAADLVHRAAQSASSKASNEYSKVRV